MSSGFESRKVETFVNLHLKDNGYSADGYEDRRFKVSVGPLVLDPRIPADLDITTFITLSRATVLV